MFNLCRPGGQSLNCLTKIEHQKRGSDPNSQSVEETTSLKIAMPVVNFTDKDTANTKIRIYNLVMVDFSASAWADNMNDKKECISTFKNSYKSFHMWQNQKKKSFPSNADKSLGSSPSTSDIIKSSHSIAAWQSKLRIPKFFEELFHVLSPPPPARSLTCTRKRQGRHRQPRSSWRCWWGRWQSWSWQGPGWCWSSPGQARYRSRLSTASSDWLSSVEKNARFIKSKRKNGVFHLSSAVDEKCGDDNLKSAANHQNLSKNEHC